MSYNLFGNSTPSNPLNAAGLNTIGTVFTSLLSGNILGVRFYKSASNTGTHVGILWDIAGTNLAQVTFTGETASGWQYMPFGSPYAILANTQYVISYSFNGNYSYNAGAPAIVGNVFGNPLGAPTNFGRSVSGSAFPTNVQPNSFMVDGVLDNVVVPSGIRDVTGEQCVVGALQGVSIGSMTSIHGDTFDRHLQVGVREELVDGYPSPPCLALDIPGMWRFKWSVLPGARSITLWVRQVSNVSGKRPTLIVKANVAIGVVADLTSTAPSGTGWVQFPVTNITAPTAGFLWVELHNNDTDNFNSTAYFDHRLVT